MMAVVLVLSGLILTFSSLKLLGNADVLREIGESIEGKRQRSLPKPNSLQILASLSFV
jgi:hypothetical protein